MNNRIVDLFGIVFEFLTLRNKKLKLQCRRVKLGGWVNVVVF